jgi:hypothetical protein
MGRSGQWFVVLSEVCAGWARASRTFVRDVQVGGCTLDGNAEGGPYVTIPDLKAAAISAAVIGLLLLAPAIARAESHELVATLDPIAVNPDYDVWTGEGSARLWLGSDPGSLCFVVTITGVSVFPPADPPQFPDDFFSAVIQTEGGDVVATLQSPVMASPATGCVAGIGDTVLTDLFANPTAYYAQVTQHSADAAGCSIFGGCTFGALRGQLDFAESAVASTAAVASTLPSATPDVVLLPDTAGDDPLLGPSASVEFVHLALAIFGTALAVAARFAWQTRLVSGRK